MVTRYTFMKPGYTIDEVSGGTYPDPLSLNYLSFSLQQDPVIITVGQSQQEPWLLAQQAYGSAALDDIVLTLNGYSHRNFLKQGDQLAFPTSTDIVNSFNKA